MERHRRNTYENLWRIVDDCAICSISAGIDFIVDAEDYDRLKDIKWYLDTGYIRNSRHIRIHRFILNNPKGFIDHINGNVFDNRKSNLRVCTPEENTLNRGAQSNNKTGYKGVCYDKSRGKYKADIKRGEKKICIGRFETAEEAAHAYDRKAIELHGEFARTNFPRKYYENEVENQ